MHKECNTHIPMQNTKHIFNLNIYIFKYSIFIKDLVSSAAIGRPLVSLGMTSSWLVQLKGLREGTPSSSTLTDLRSESWETHKLNKAKCTWSSIWVRAISWIGTGWRMNGFVSSPMDEDLRILVDKEMRCELAVCTCTPENHFDHIKRSIASRSSGVIVLTFSAVPLWDCTWIPVSSSGTPSTVGVNLEEGHKNHQSAGVPLLWGRTDTVGVVQLKDNETSGWPYCGPNHSLILKESNLYNLLV